jgi:hypothetical protein
MVVDAAGLDRLSVRRTMRHERASDYDVSPRVCPEFVSSHTKAPLFSARFVEGGGLKNRYRQRKKNAIGQVFACRILTDCGEVAEWPKAAVC